MTELLTRFFAARSEADAGARTAAPEACMADGFVYSDPRSGGRIGQIGALSAHVGAFSASAPGWTATLEAADEVNGFVRAGVAFAGPGPDGAAMMHRGTDFAELDDTGRLVRLAGFRDTVA